MAEKKTARKPPGTAKKKAPAKTGKKGYEAHPIAEMFPMLPGPEIKLLSDSIKTVGQKDPIWLAEGKILDGRNRKIACEMVGVEPRYENVPEGADLLEFMLACNAEKRNLSASQRAMVAAKLDGHTHGGDRVSGDREELFTLEELSERFRVSDNYIKQARKIIADCDPKVAAAVEAGSVKVGDAGKEAVRETPHAEQRKALELVLADPGKPPATMVSALRQIRDDREIEKMQEAAAERFAQAEAEKAAEELRKRLEENGISEEEYLENQEAYDKAWAKEDAERAAAVQREYEEMDSIEPIAPLVFPRRERQSLHSRRHLRCCHGAGGTRRSAPPHLCRSRPRASPVLP